MNPELLKSFNSFISEESENDPSLILDSYDGKIDIEWEDDSPVTPYGGNLQQIHFSAVEILWSQYYQVFIFL